jgi:hypothetical protein
LDHTSLIVLVAALAAVVMLGFWCLMLWTLSRISGWQQLASRYATHRLPAGRRFAWQSARLGWLGYNNCMSMHASVDGLFIQPWAVFRLAHPPLLIPWTELRNGRKRRSFGIDWMDFQLQNPPGFKLALPARVVQQHALQRSD